MGGDLIHNRMTLPTRLERHLRCPQCHGEFRHEESSYQCKGCEERYPVEQNVACLLPPQRRDGGDEAFYSAPDPQRYGRTELPGPFVEQIRRFLRHCPDDGLALEIGSGGGALDGVHPAYVASDLSLFALLRYSHAPCVQADAQALPFADATVDAILTYASLEHVPSPAVALAEIDRCLRPGGRAFIYPAWYVRPWAARALHMKPYRDLPWADRLRKLTIPLRDSRGWWLAKLLPGRVARELALRSGRKSLRFSYRRLDPNLESFVASDSDAFGSMDAHTASAYFLSRGYTDMHRPTALRRLLYGNEPVVVRKS